VIAILVRVLDLETPDDEYDQLPCFDAAGVPPTERTGQA
jgi:hypothetical protein